MGTWVAFMSLLLQIKHLKLTQYCKSTILQLKKFRTPKCQSVGESLNKMLCPYNVYNITIKAQNKTKIIRQIYISKIVLGEKKW